MKLNKDLIRQELFSYGTARGYPHKIGPKEFLELHLNDFFKHLLAKGLVKPEWYKPFKSAAILQYQCWFMVNR